MSTSESAKKDIIEYLEDQFNDPSITWQKAYDIEQKLVFIMSPEQLDVEWDRRIVEAEDLGLPFASVLKQKYVNIREDAEKMEKNLSTKRALMHRLINDLQWFYQKRSSRREMAKILSTRVSWLFWFAFALFAFAIYKVFSAHTSLPSPS
jgi:hypothetical protein